MLAACLFFQQRRDTHNLVDFISHSIYSSIMLLAHQLQRTTWQLARNSISRTGPVVATSLSSFRKNVVQYRGPETAPQAHDVHAYVVSDHFEHV